MCGNIFCHYRAGANHSTFTNRYTSQNRSISANRCSFFDNGLQRLLKMLGPREVIICESCIRTDKNVIFNLNAIPNLNTGLNGNIITYTNIILDEHSRANITITSYNSLFENNTKLPDICVLSNTRRFTIC